MFAITDQFNIVAVTTAVLAYFILGALWFTPLFGKAYDKAIGVDRSKKQKWPLLYYIGPFVGTIITTLATATLIYTLKIENLWDGVVLGCIVGLGYAGAISFTNAITPNTPRPLLFGLITGSYHFVGIIIVSAIITILN